MYTVAARFSYDVCIPSATVHFDSFRDSMFNPGAPVSVRLAHFRSALFAAKIVSAIFYSIPRSLPHDSQVVELVEESSPGAAVSVETKKKKRRSNGAASSKVPVRLVSYTAVQYFLTAVLYNTRSTWSLFFVQVSAVYFLALQTSCCVRRFHSNPSFQS